MKIYTMISFLLIACGLNLGQISASEQPEKSYTDAEFALLEEIRFESKKKASQLKHNFTDGCRAHVSVANQDQWLLDFNAPCAQMVAFLKLMKEHPSLHTGNARIILTVESDTSTQLLTPRVNSSTGTSIGKYRFHSIDDAIQSIVYFGTSGAEGHRDHMDKQSKK
ncbi:MAG: hypothetical protein K2X90_00280 [Candidatus Babeliaceae bacterium]|nr:hypothetical protein [Candidatus Babeliaceae bacterium]